MSNPTSSPNMPRIVPKVEKSKEDPGWGLEPKQVVALESLLLGSTATEAARVAGVDRRTLFRWLRSNAEFQSAINRGRREAREVAIMRLERLADSAVSALERALGEGDARSALTVLRGLGLLNGSWSIGPEDAEVLALQARAAEIQWQREACLLELGL